NSSQQPTRGRSLARRFRASLCATLRVALLDREGRARLSERTLAGRDCNLIMKRRPRTTIGLANRIPPACRAIHESSRNRSYEPPPYNRSAGEIQNILWRPRRDIA